MSMHVVSLAASGVVASRHACWLLSTSLFCHFLLSSDAEGTVCGCSMLVYNPKALQRLWYNLVSPCSITKLLLSWYFSSTSILCNPSVKQKNCFQCSCSLINQYKPTNLCSFGLSWCEMRQSLQGRNALQMSDVFLKFFLMNEHTKIKWNRDLNSTSEQIVIIVKKEESLEKAFVEMLFLTHKIYKLCTFVSFNMQFYIYEDNSQLTIILH